MVSRIVARAQHWDIGHLADALGVLHLHLDGLEHLADGIAHRVHVGRGRLAVAEALDVIHEDLSNVVDCCRFCHLGIPFYLCRLADLAWEFVKTNPIYLVVGIE